MTHTNNKIGQEEAAQEAPPPEGYQFGPYGQEPPPPNLPSNQHDYPEHYFQNTNAYAPPPNAYSPVPNFVGHNPNQQAYGGASAYPPPGATPAPDGYGYHQQAPHPGPYQGNNVSRKPRDFEHVKEGSFLEPNAIPRV